MTPVELAQIHEKFSEDRLVFFEGIQIANYAGFGQVNAGKQFKSVFERHQKTVQRRVTQEQKMKELEEIQRRLGGC